jgi:magnesium transporter
VSRGRRRSKEPRPRPEPDAAGAVPRRPTVTLVRYGPEEIDERRLGSASDIAAARSLPGVKWVNVDGVHSQELLAVFGREFGIHSLVLEDIAHTRQRAKVEDYSGYLYSCVRMLSLDGDQVAGEQVSVILGEDYVLTFQEEEREGDVFDELRVRLRAGKGQLRRSGADFLYHAILDSIVDQYFLILEAHEERIGEIEEGLDESPRSSCVQEIHLLKRQTITLRRSIWPMRELVGHLERGEWPLLSSELNLYLRDLYDHTVRAIEMTESSMDLLSTIHDLSLSLVSNRLNAIMKVLTIISTIFIPLTFIAGVYGMNFRFMPEIAWRWGYPVVLGGMLVVAGVMLVVFKRKKWF